ncbi:phage tail protein [Shimia thalassica]|uniref:phage tail protein n=1 Tax=Shimia thalassica TaxID=1715693 RepID=UPI0026E45F6F|nr:phage tail protein [Shimia thalassica]MDO6799355.1 phage tail protein [Shimia thalassica]
MVAMISALLPGLTGSITVGGVALTTAAGGLTVAGTLANLGGSLLLSSAANALAAPSVSQQQTRWTLSDLSSLLTKRFVYGETRAVGSRIVRCAEGKNSNNLYLCYLLNSRASEGEFELLLDKRRVTLTGNPYDFTGSGGAASNYPFVNYTQVWFGLGDQSGPPDEILDDMKSGASDPVLATDAAQGCTVVWIKLHAGPPGERVKRWKSMPPFVEVEGKFSKVWDPRDVSQDADDPATWQWSENHALCVLDALRTNPTRPYQTRNLLIDQWKVAADASEEIVSLKSGGSEKRYSLGGTLAFDGAEIEDAIAPLMTAGAADFVRSAGRLGIRPAVWVAPVHELVDVLEYATVQTLQPGENLSTQVNVNYTSKARQYEEAALAPWSIPGAQAADGGAASVVEYGLHWAGSAQQAMRVRKILGLRARRQKTFAGVAPPSFAECEAGDNITVNLPSPFVSRNGTYEIRSTHPAIDALGEGGVAMRCPVSLIEHSSDIYDWDPATDEEDIDDPVYDGTDDDMDPPGAITVTSGAGVDLDNGGALIPRFRFAFAPSVSAAVTGYEWQWRLDGEPWQAGGVIGAEIIDDDDDVIVYLPASSVSVGHDFRVRAVGRTDISDWIDLTGAFYDMSLSGVAAVAGLGFATFTGTAPANSVFTGVRIYRNTIDDFDSATMVAGLNALDTGESFIVHAGDETTVNLLADEGFDDAADWSMTGGWVVSGGIATHTLGAVSKIRQTPSLTDGATYRCAVDVDRRDAGSVTFYSYGSSQNQSSSISTTGQSFGMVVAPTGATQIGVRADSAFDGDIDNLIAYEQTAAHLAQGEAYFWIVPVTTTGAEGQPNGPHQLTII